MEALHKRIWIDLDIGPFMRGLGDALTLAWLAEGNAGRMAFRTSGARLELLRLFGQEVYDRDETPDLPAPIGVSDAYLDELADGGRRPRLAYLAEYLNRHGAQIEAVWGRPKCVVTGVGSGQWVVDSGQWVVGSASPAAHCTLSTDHSPLTTLLFPQTHWATRAWPACYWVELAWQLHAAGHNVEVLLERPDRRFQNVPYWRSGLALPELIATVRRAALVIGNDSFGAHLSGTLAVPTVVLLGPTRAGCVFGHFFGPGGTVPRGGAFLPLAGELDCTGCHFDAKKNFRAACDQGCLSLHRLLPETVFEAARRLAGLTSSPAGSA